MKQEVKYTITAHLRGDYEISSHHYCVKVPGFTHFVIGGLSLHVQDGDFAAFARRLRTILENAGAEIILRIDANEEQNKLDAQAETPSKPNECTCNGFDICIPCQKAMADDYANNPNLE